MPLILRGNLNPDNYYPTWMNLPTKDEMRLINSSYTKGSALAETMERVRNRPVAMMQRVDDNDAHVLARVAAQELKREDGPRVAVFDIGALIPTPLKAVKMANMANVWRIMIKC